MDHDQITALLTDVGVLIGALSLTPADDTDDWAFEFEDGPAVFFAPTTREDVYCVSVDVEEVGAEAREALFHLMLQYNEQSRETGGVRLGLDSEDVATATVDLHGSEVTTNRLARVIDEVRALREAWAKVIDGWRGDEAGGDDAPGLSPIMRV